MFKLILFFLSFSLYADSILWSDLYIPFDADKHTIIFKENFVGKEKDIYTNRKFKIFRNVNKLLVIHDLDIESYKELKKLSRSDNYPIILKFKTIDYSFIIINSEITDELLTEMNNIKKWILIGKNTENCDKISKYISLNKTCEYIKVCSPNTFNYTIISKSDKIELVFD